MGSLARSSALTQSPVKVTWGGVSLSGFADDEYFSIDPALARESLATICEWRETSSLKSSVAESAT